VNLGRIKDIDVRTINELFLLTQPAHLQSCTGKKLDSDARRQARADYIRSRLKRQLKRRTPRRQVKKRKKNCFALLSSYLGVLASWRSPFVTALRVVRVAT
jgi:hypothetical protein